MNQRALPYPRHRTRPEPTRVEDKRAQLQYRKKFMVLAHLHLEPEPVTCQELAQNCALTAREVSRALPKLQAEGYAVSGYPRPCTVTGRNATVWLSVRQQRRLDGAA